MTGHAIEPGATARDRATEIAHLEPRVHPTYARLLAAELRRRGFPHEAIFQGTRLSWDALLEDDRFLSFERFRSLIDRGLELTGEPWLGLDVGRTTQISSHGPLGFALIASPDVGRALDLVERFSELRLLIARFSVEREDGRARLRIDDTVGWGGASEYVQCHIVGAISLLLETLSGTPLPDTRVTFSHAEPSWAHEYAPRLGGATCAFGARSCAIDLPQSFARAPCITADAAALRDAVRICERAETRRESEDDVAQRVLERLLDREGGYPDSSEMAALLHMSSRTLLRKLRAQGTSYQALLDDVRQERTLWYLRHTDQSVESIAERLGYRDGSNFSRTCKRWFGQTPRAIRRGGPIP